MSSLHRVRPPRRALGRRRQGKVAEAEPLYHEALKGRRELLGPRHPDTLSSAKWAAKLLNESGRAEEAARLRSEYGV